MEIDFSKRAKKTLNSIQIYIQEKFGENVLVLFDQKVIDFLELLKKFPQIGSVENKEKQIFGFQITKQTRVFYRIEKNNIIILSFFDVRQNPNNKL